LQAKDIILALNNEPAKYFDQAKAILEKYKKQDYFSNRLEMKKIRFLLLYLLMVN
jgi:hypothetical protein